MSLCRVFEPGSVGPHPLTRKLCPLLLLLPPLTLLHLVSLSCGDWEFPGWRTEHRGLWFNRKQTVANAWSPQSSANRQVLQSHPVAHQWGNSCPARPENPRCISPPVRVIFKHSSKVELYEISASLYFLLISGFHLQYEKITVEENQRGLSHTDSNARTCVFSAAHLA